MSYKILHDKMSYTISYISIYIGCRVRYRVWYRIRHIMLILFKSKHLDSSPPVLSGCWQTRMLKARCRHSSPEARQVSPWFTMGISTWCCGWSCAQRGVGSRGRMDVLRVPHGTPGFALASNEACRVDWGKSFRWIAYSYEERGQVDCRRTKLDSHQQRGVWFPWTSAHVWRHQMGVWPIQRETQGAVLSLRHRRSSFPRQKSSGISIIVYDIV